jgi:hypothetical protein
MAWNAWRSLVMELAVWVGDAIRAWASTLTWRDGLLLLILLGLWTALRDLGRLLWRLRQLHEKVDEREDFNDFSRFYQRLQDIDDKLDNLQRTLEEKSAVESWSTTPRPPYDLTGSPARDGAQGQGGGVGGIRRGDNGNVPTVPDVYEQAGR